MKRALVLTGVTLSAATVLTGCGGKKEASTVARTARPSGAATRSPMPRASTTVRGTVKVGRFCGTAGAVGKTDTGSWARCAKRQGDSRPRWYSQTRGGTAHAGQFCSTVGSTAKSSTGTRLVCSKKRGDARARWHTK